MSGGDDEARIEALVREGRHAEAAALARAAGQHVRASQLFAAAWRFADAVAEARAAGDLALAYAHALASGDPSLSGALVPALGVLPAAEVRAAARLAESRGRTVEAARLEEVAGDLAAAAALYEQAGETFEAARCVEATGDLRRAGMLYEAHLRHDPSASEAALRLGTILARFGRYEPAARALQVAERDPERRDPALRLQIAAFRAAGLDTAASACLARLRAHHPDLPATVDGLVASGILDLAGTLGGAEGASSDLLAGRYRVARELGAGGAGRVLLARDVLHDRDVAVKVLTVSASGRGRDAYARFAREAQVASDLDHPHLVRVFDYDPSGPFLVMEYLPGGTLEDRLAAAGDAGLALAVVRSVLGSLLDALETLHLRGVIHRDLKPANVLFGAAGEVKLGDFGVAHLTDLGATLTGAMLGTVAYMAPEQLGGDARPTPRTDLYALGVLLFRMLTGRLPFPGPDFVAQHLAGARERVGALDARLGDRFEGFVDRLLARDPEARFASATAARDVMASLDWSEPASRGATALAAPSRAPSPSGVPAPTPEHPTERYQPLGEAVSDGFRARDTLLGRTVLVLPCSPERATQLVALARADGPFLQAVYDVDTEAGRCVVEDPVGLPLSAIDAGALDGPRVEAELRDALARIHASGLAHGAVDAAHVRVGAGRAVLLLPELGRGGDPDADRAALAALFR